MSVQLVPTFNLSLEIIPTKIPLHIRLSEYGVVPVVFPTVLIEKYDILM